MDPSVPAWTIGPLGERLTAAALPPAAPPRWFPRLKAQVVAAVRGGLIDEDEACARYDITSQEYASWCRGLELGGLNGVRASRVQDARDRHERMFKAPPSSTSIEEVPPTSKGSCGRQGQGRSPSEASAAIFGGRGCC